MHDPRRSTKVELSNIANVAAAEALQADFYK